MALIFVDTDVVLDLLSQREPFYIHAAKLFTLADRGAITICISSLCFNNLNYLLSKQYGSAESRRKLVRFRSLIKILAVDDNIIDLALHSAFADFEDAIQYHVAIENQVPIIITRNLKDYRSSEIPVMTAEIYLSKYQS